MKTFAYGTLALLLMLPTGCEKPNVETAPATLAEAEGAKANEASTEKADDEKESDGEESIDMTGVKYEPPPITSEPREFEAKDAKRGKKSRKAGGYLGAVAGARFYAEYEMVINSYKQALNLYWATEGDYPKTHEEFMEKIIKFNKIQLPELEAGVEYIYDPEDHLLKVYRPEG